MNYYFGINRTLCNVFEEMRKCFETRNFSGLLGLIEEAQTMANRMEAALQDKKDVIRAHDTLKELKAEIKILEAKKKEGGL